MSATKITVDSDSAIIVSFDESDPKKNITQKMSIAFVDHIEKDNSVYFIQNVTVMYTENVLPGSKSDKLVSIRKFFEIIFIFELVNIE